MFYCALLRVDDVLLCLYCVIFCFIVLYRGLLCCIMFSYILFCFIMFGGVFQCRKVVENDRNHTTIQINQIIQHIRNKCGMNKVVKNAKRLQNRNINIIVLTCHSSFF